MNIKKPKIYIFLLETNIKLSKILKKATVTQALRVPLNNSATVEITSAIKKLFFIKPSVFIVVITSKGIIMLSIPEKTIMPFNGPLALITPLTPCQIAPKELISNETTDSKSIIYNCFFSLIIVITIIKGINL